MSRVIRDTLEIFDDFASFECILCIAIYDLDAKLTQEKLMNTYRIVRVRIGWTIRMLFIAYSQHGWLYLLHVHAGALSQRSTPLLMLSLGEKDWQSTNHPCSHTTV
jgi:hypothetical protein